MRDIADHHLHRGENDIYSNADPGNAPSGNRTFVPNGNQLQAGVGMARMVVVVFVLRHDGSYTEGSIVDRAGDDDGPA